MTLDKRNVFFCTGDTANLSYNLFTNPEGFDDTLPRHGLNYLHENHIEAFVKKKEDWQWKENTMYWYIWNEKKTFEFFRGRKIKAINICYESTISVKRIRVVG